MTSRNSIPIRICRNSNLCRILSLVLFGAVWGGLPAEYRDSTQTTPAILLKAASGISQAKLEALVQIPARHQFTVARSNTTLRVYKIAEKIRAPATIARTPQRIAKEREMESLAKRFSPDRVRLNMTVAEVEQIFDAPHLIEMLDDGSELRYYGSSKFGYYFDFHWLCVAYRNGKATAVFTHDFCNQRKLVKPKPGSQ